ncbi:peptidoglycan DD-metalloendopeptidase family protein [Methylophilus sp. VKM B-3414]|uniref:peptidoglycan DD-metalloendopeptidase family protein n=1 Tax=Methylophilus sp. VKM B-3414 TaxID=3076121 RepID=UPI0028C7C0E1|nr:peptidoglycan DD-metalloendopeptidase family protein [Methylophilus sp. VKM B-3414]MDT7848410.1 peptidoglycan DD-metalloendopeptidase family protein [Methylophilus sp. VKM B-3414]
MNLRTLLTACGTACTLAACALNSPMPRAPVVTSVSPAPESKPAAPVSVGANQYLVQKGDTLYSIGRKFGIPFMKLAEFNQLQAPYEIHVGQVLNLTAKSSTSATNNKATDPAGADDAEVVTSAISRPDMSAAPEAASTANAAPALQTTTEGEKSAAPLDLEAINDSDIQWQWPLAGKVSAGFDVQTNKGLNITGSAGQAVNAAGAGKVIYSGMDVRGYGKLIIVKHNSNLLSVYAHQGNSLVKEGVFVTQGEKLATLPAPANNKLPVLHFEIRQKGKPVDPATYLPSTPATASSH